MGAHKNALVGFSPQVHLPLEEVETDPVVNIGSKAITAEHKYSMLGQQVTIVNSELYSMEYSDGKTQLVIDSPDYIAKVNQLFWFSMWVEADPGDVIFRAWDSTKTNETITLEMTAGRNLRLSMVNPASEIKTRIIPSVPDEPIYITLRQTYAIATLNINAGTSYTLTDSTFHFNIDTIEIGNYSPVDQRCVLTDGVNDLTDGSEPLTIENCANPLTDGTNDLTDEYSEILTD